MTAPKDNPSGVLWMLGLALTLPMILLSGPLGGFLISVAVIHRFGAPEYLTPLLTALGLLASGWQSYQLIQRLNQESKKEK